MANGRPTYWRVLLRFGLPFVVIFHIIDYAFFPASVVVGRGHWLRTVLLDIPIAFIVSALFYLLLVFFRFRKLDGTSIDH
jgi:hypothetical protein